MKITDDVLAVLSGCEIDGTSLRITSQLERSLYVQVNKVLEAAGGKWNRGAKAHLFPSDAETIIDQVIVTGEITVPQELGWFPSPNHVVSRLLEFAEVSPGMFVLEPSAGEGAITSPLVQLGATVIAIEIDPDRCDHLRASEHRPYRVHQGDFLSVAPSTSPKYQFDRVIMNPPFAKKADIIHVGHALRFLRSGGRLVSVMSPGFLFRQEKAYGMFRDLIAPCNPVHEILPEGSFKESGTMVNAVILRLDMP